MWKYIALAVSLMPNGSKRSAQWENTNDELERDSYDGVKTGNTDQVGACLTAGGHQ
jgi:D-alanyl-D-alanine carboxypeptidase